MAQIVLVYESLRGDILISVQKPLWGWRARVPLKNSEEVAIFVVCNLVSYDLSFKKNFCTHSTKTLMVGLFLISDKISSTFLFFSVRVDFLSALRFPNSDLFPCLAVSGWWKFLFYKPFKISLLLKG